MIHDGRVVGLPLVMYSGDKSALEALSGLEAGMIAYASDQKLLGYHIGTAWGWLLPTPLRMGQHVEMDRGFRVGQGYLLGVNLP